MTQTVRSVITSLRLPAAPRSFLFSGLLLLLLVAPRTGAAQLVQISRGPSAAATEVGASSAPQNLLLQTTVAETIASFTVTPSAGNIREYSVGVVTGCAVDGTTVNPPGTVCTLPITFRPAYPGLRSVPLQAVTSTGTVNFGLNASGLAPLAAITPGTTSTVAGSRTANNCNAYSGPALLGPLCNPSAGAVDAAGNIYVAAFYSNTVSKIDPSGNTTVIAGTGAGGLSGVGGPATSATFDRPSDVVVDPAGNVYFAAEYAEQVFKIDAVTHILTSIAGNGNTGFSGDGGPATLASFNRPEGLALDASGSLFVEDQDNNVIRKIDTLGIITTYAGNPATIGQGVTPFTGDGGPALGANLQLCCSGVYASYDAIAVDAAGNLFIGDSGHQVVREVSAADQTIRTIAGNNALGAGFAGDGGAATGAQMNFPMGVAVDPAGDVYIADFSNNCIRKVDAATQTISTVAGDPSGNNTVGDGGPATQVTLGGPQKVVLDGAGNLYIADTKNNLVRKTDVSHLTLTFPTPTAVGSTDTGDGPLQAIVSNIGNQPLIVAQPTTESNPSVSPGFQLVSTGPGACPMSTPPSPGTLAEGSSCTLTTDFAPISPGNITGSLVLTDNSLNQTSPGATQTISFGGTATAAPGPQPALTPATLDFGSLTVGSPSGVQTATLSNSGNGPLAIAGFALTGASISSFSQSNNCGGSLAAGASCAIAVTCTPATTGALSASVNVTFSDAGLNLRGTHANDSVPAQLSVNLTCNGTAAPAPGAALSPATASFGSLTTGTTSPAQVFTLTNPGNAPLTISGISLAGANPADFVIGSNSCGATLAAAATCTVSVMFRPAAVGSFTASLSVADNAPGSPQTSALTGTGTAPAVPGAALSPATASFGSLTTGTTSPAQVFTLTNPGNAPLTISSISLAGANPADFVIGSNSCGATLAAAATCTVSVTFTPAAVGSFNASLSVADNAPGSPQTSVLTGSGAIPPDFIVAAAPATQTLNAGATATFSISVSSTGGSFSSPVALTATGLPPGATVVFSPASVTPGSSPALASMTVQTAAQQTAGVDGRSRWPLAAPVLAALLLLVPLRRRPRERAYRLLRTLGCGVVLLGLGMAAIGCGGGFALPATASPQTFTITVSGASGSDTHSTTVTLTVQ